MYTLNENFVTPIIEQAPDDKKIERFLSDLGYNQMYYQYKKDLRQLERIFSKILRGRNLAMFQKLMHPAPTSQEKSAERQLQKDTAANQDFAAKKIQYDDIVSQLQKLQPMQLIDKYIEAFNLPAEKKMELYYELLEPKQYSDPEFPEIGTAELDMFDEKSEEWIEKIATKLVYGGDEKPF
jgi:hypothetical protein